MEKNILIVDDEHLILWGLSRSLEDCCNFPVEIKCVESCQRALAEIRSRFYDLCFLDIRLPDGSGLDVMKKIKEISPDTRIVIITATMVDRDMEREIKENAYAFSAKPFNCDQIRTLAKNVLEGNSFRRSGDNAPPTRDFPISGDGANGSRS